MICSPPIDCQYTCNLYIVFFYFTCNFLFKVLCLLTERHIVVAPLFALLDSPRCIGNTVEISSVFCVISRSELVHLVAVSKDMQPCCKQ